MHLYLKLETSYKSIIILYNVWFIHIDLYNENIGKIDGWFSFDLNSDISYSKTQEENSILEQNVYFQYISVVTNNVHAISGHNTYIWQRNKNVHNWTSKQ